MATTIQTTFPVITTHTLFGQRLVAALTLADSPRLNHSTAMLAQQLVAAWHKTWLAEGEYLEVVRLLSDLPVHQEQITVGVPASTHPGLYPPHVLIFDIFLQALTTDNTNSRMIGYLPVLGIEASASTVDGVKALLIEGAQLEFIRKNRLASVHKLVELNWYQAAECQMETVALTFYTPSELEKLSEQGGHSLLAKVATALTPGYSKTVGLEAELQQMQNLLSPPHRQNILLVGPNGCGKTALLNGYAHTGTGLWETTAAGLIQGLTEDSGWQHNLALLCRELRDSQQILYVNHLSELFEVGQYVGNTVSIGEALREPLQRGEILLIAEATASELARLDLRSPGFSSLFSQVVFAEKTDAEKLRIAQQAIESLAQQHQIAVATAAIQELIQLQQRYFPYSGFPGKTIRFLETLILREKHRTLLQPGAAIDREHVLTAFCQESAMPRTLVDSEYPFDATATREFFAERVFGQPQAIDTILSLLTAIKTAVLRSGKPIANLLFIGPTGVGKTEMAKTLADYIFSDPTRILRLDMSEYATPEAVLRLTGDGGYADASLVTQVRQQPFAVVLFDELEKAHPNFFDLLLQILGEGRLTDQHGQIANFCSTIVIMTSNLGAEGFQQQGMGFTLAQSQQQVNQHFIQAVQTYFRPELFNRIDQIIPFNPLAIAIQPRIVERQMRLLQQRDGLAAHTLHCSEAALQQLGRGRYDNTEGARQMHRSLHQQVIIPLAHQLNASPQGKTKIELCHELNQKGSAGLTLRLTPQITTPQDTHLPETANQLAKDRRQFQAIQEGPVYIALLNELDKLTAKKQRLGEQFWKRPEETELFHQLTRYQQQAQHLFATLTELETHYLRLILGLEIPTGSTEATHPTHEAWQQSWLDFKMGLYQRHTPASRQATLAIYGRNPLQLKPLLQFYQAICQRQHFECTPYRVWLNAEGTYYRSQDTAPGADKPSPDKLIGYELALCGNCPELYWRAEAGLIRWVLAEGDKQDYWVVVSEQAIALDGASSAFKTPEGVHRQRFFDGLQPRIYFEVETSYFHDKELTRQYPLQPPDERQQQLQQHFIRLLDEELVRSDHE